MLLRGQKFYIDLGCKDPETKSGRTTLLGVVSGEQKRNRPRFLYGPVSLFKPVLGIGISIND